MCGQGLQDGGQGFSQVILTGGTQRTTNQTGQSRNPQSRVQKPAIWKGARKSPLARRKAALQQDSRPT